MTSSAHDTGSSDFETIYSKARIRQNRRAQITYANQSCSLDRIDLEDFLNLPCELFDIVANSGGTKITKIGKIFPYLPGINADQIGQISAGYIFLSLFCREYQSSKINWQPSNCLIWNFSESH